MEFLVRVEDGGNGMPIGGIIAIRENGADWTVPELTALYWRLFRCDGLTDAEHTSLLEVAFVDGIVKKRQMHLNSNFIIANKWPREQILVVTPQQVRNLYQLA